VDNSEQNGRTWVIDEERLASPCGLDPTVRALWTLQDAAFWGGTTLTLAVVAAMSPGWGAPLWLVWLLAGGAMIGALLGAVLTWQRPRVLFASWRFVLTGEGLEAWHGRVWRLHSAIPYLRIQYIDIEQGPLERALGLSRLAIHTAARSSHVTIPGLASADAEVVRRVLLARTGDPDVR
jgi:membrane protein YdbS with pleckstrin-like domain